MKLFLTSFPKSGTHQIYPAFASHPDMPQIVDRCHSQTSTLPERYGLNSKINEEGAIETAQNLKKCSTEKAFGHLSYHPLYDEAFREMGTKVIFNVRDPRDIVVAEYERGMKYYKKTEKSPIWTDLVDNRAGCRILQKDDPLFDLIFVASKKWPHWLGWVDKPYVYVIHYEDIRQSPVPTLTSLVEWMEKNGYAPRTAKQLIVGVLPKHGNPTFRKGAVGEWKTYFTEKHKRLSDRILRDIIEKLGYEN